RTCRRPAGQGSRLSPRRSRSGVQEHSHAPPLPRPTHRAGPFAARSLPLGCRPRGRRRRSADARRPGAGAGRRRPPAPPPAALPACWPGARRTLLKGGVLPPRDRQVGDFARADVLIEDGKIREIRPDIAVAPDAAAVVDAANRVVIPGFIDTHSHSYQGLLRNILVSGLLNPDYNRAVHTTLTPAYQAADAYAGVLVTALGMIAMGTTAMVDISQVSHTPEHSDACIRALQESGIRAVFSYHRGAGPAAQYPQDIKRLQRSYF